MQKRWIDGTSTSRIVSRFVKPNDRLSSFERLEIYNRQYWFRILDSFYEDYPGLRAVLGDSVFLRMAETYLTHFPSRSWTMRNLGSGIVRFLTREPHWAKKKQTLALEVARFEWAQIEAFDAASKPPLNFEALEIASPNELRLGLQPHVQLLALTYPVDDFVLAVKGEGTARGQASNAINTVPRTSELKRVPLPKPKLTHVAIHRFQNALYYKKLEPRGYSLLKALQKGYSLEEACIRALRAASRGTDWEQKVRDWFQTWAALGWFCECMPVSSETRGACRSQVLPPSASRTSRRLA
jgi:Putative DNA-binding domain